MLSTISSHTDEEYKISDVLRVPQIFESNEFYIDGEQDRSASDAVLIVDQTFVQSRPHQISCRATWETVGSLALLQPLQQSPS